MGLTANTSTTPNATADMGKSQESPCLPANGMIVLIMSLPFPLPRLTVLLKLPVRPYRKINFLHLNAKLKKICFPGLLINEALLFLFVGYYWFNLLLLFSR